MSWQDLKEFENDYEIWAEFPYQIRKKSNHRIVKEWVDKSKGGYVICRLNGKNYLKHRIIASNFIDNPENYEFVDHIDRNKANNSISNLRWCSRKWNNNNLSTQNFVDEISPDCLVVDKYSKWEFEFLYFDPDNNNFYVYNGINYVVKPRFQNKFGYWHIQICDKDGKRRYLSFRKFKREYGLI